MPTPSTPSASVVALLLALAVTGPVAAVEDYGDCFTLGADGCPLRKLNCPLVQPPTLFAAGGVLDTSLTVVEREVDCVPQVAQSGTPPTAAQVDWATMTLRNYASPATPGGALTGPTWRVRKAVLQDPTAEYDPTTNPIATPGTRLRVLLRNTLPNDPRTPIDSCEPALFPVCTDNPTQVCTCTDPNGACDAATLAGFVCDASDPSRTCRVAQIEEEAPNCFHGPEVTNLHYHGTHVSPQPHSDFVLLSLYSENQVDPPPPEPGDDPTIAIGTYQTDIAPFPWNQPPGTHWYHPHKHGSTAVQLLNGMAGALLIGGELDDFLLKSYGVGPLPFDQPGDVEERLERFEKVMVVQQIGEETSFFQAGRKPKGQPPYPLVNGQLIPTIEMRYGEVQRWRLISATSNSVMQSVVGLDLDPSTFPGFEVRQIAQDGIQFHPSNYVRQPLGNGVDGFELSPGNRVDLLVRAPDPPPDMAPMTFYLMRTVVGAGLGDDERAAIAAQNRLVNALSGVPAKRLKDESASGALVRVHVSGVQSPAMQLPSRWPEMPPYLDDLTASGVRWVGFSMPNDATGGSGQGTPQSKFYIDGLQYSHDCAGETLELDVTEEWRITNNSVPQHPFHIHVNPFQLVSRRWSVDANGNVIAPRTQNFDPPYPWMDTVALRPGRLNRQSDTRLLYRAQDYSGAYVLHCHFLGHEDRGMMTNVQAVCPTTSTATAPIQFGTPTPDGTPDDCTVAPADAAPLFACPAAGVAENDDGGGHAH